MLFNADERAGTDELVEVISEAIRGWLVGVRDSVDSVVAAGGMDLGLEVYRVIAPALGAEFIATAASDAPVTGVDRLDSSLSWPDGVDGPATVGELLAEYPGTFAGVDPSQVSFVVASPVWRGEFDRYLKTAVNLVVGMEDSTFRKMSALLSDVKLGGRFDQLQAVRSFLSWEAEGGYEGWMRRAERIARTELQVARSHAVFTSARMLADAGVRVEKMWSCLLPDTPVSAHGVTAGARIHYEGPTVRVSTASGSSFTCTPEHRVLTGRGWVRADSVSKSDYLVHVGRQNTSGAPDIETRQAMIGDLVDAAIQSRPVEVGAVSGGVNFYSDISRQEVDVVPADRRLRDNAQTGVFEGVGNAPLVSADCLGVAGRLRGGNAFALGVGNCPSGIGGAQAGGSPLLDLLRFSIGAQQPGLGPTSDTGVGFDQHALDGGLTDSEVLGSGSLGSAVLVEADDVVSVEAGEFSGQVYDLSTESNWFLADGLIVHNCAHDERTREWHAAADGQVRDVNDPFDVGGEPLMFPGDREHGSAKNCIQCRCNVTYVPEEDGVDLREVARVTSLEDVNRMIEETMMSDSMVASGVRGLSWEGVLAPLGEATGDGRVFEEDGAFRFRQFPLPLLWQESTGEGHDTSRVVGTIEGGEVQDGRITAWGTVFEDEEKLVALLEKGVVRPSVDLCDMEAEVRGESEGEERLHVLSATVMAATLVATPAFENVGIELSGGVVDVEPEGLVASAGVEFEEYNAGAFSDPKLDGPTPLTVTDGGLVFGHLALWDTCHVGQPRRCVTPPRSECGYAAFHQSTIRTEKGMLAVGRLTVGGGHADTRAGVRAAAEHYDQTGSCWAFVRAGEDEFGVWVAGQVNKDCDAARVREAASAPLSGDWRRVGGGMELVAALSVSTPGFPVRREFAEAGVGMSLVATAGVPTEHEPEEREEREESGGSVSSGTYAETMRALREFFGDDSDGVDDSLAGRWEAARSVFAKDSLEAAAVVFDDDDDSEEVE